MSTAVIEPSFEVYLPQSASSKLQREREAFFRMRPDLLATHRGQYVAIHEEQVVDCGTNQVEVALRVQRRVGQVPIIVHFVSEEPDPIARFGPIREVAR